VPDLSEGAASKAWGSGCDGVVEVRGMGSIPEGGEGENVG
jgi:hypothetical protein